MIFKSLFLLLYKGRALVTFSVFLGLEDGREWSFLSVISNNKTII
jgi:hypothetical protein